MRACAVGVRASARARMALVFDVNLPRVSRAATSVYLADVCAASGFWCPVHDPLLPRVQATSLWRAGR